MLITFFGYTPPARYDYVAWTSARIEQGDTETGSFTAVETIPLLPTDFDPRFPATRGLTTTLATADKWYRIVWIDTHDVESQPTQASQFIGDVSQPYADVAELADILKIDYPGDFDAALERVMLTAAGEIRSEIGENAGLNAWKMALVQEVNLERASEHWVQLKSPFGFVGLDVEVRSTPAVGSHESWARHAEKLAPVKFEWGIG